MSLVRSSLKAGLLGISLARVAASFGQRRQRMNREERANWLQDAACTVLRSMGVQVVAAGNPPLTGLVVSNHLSYLDVLAYAAVMPCVFVAKQEVRAWPVFGAFATMAGTIFVDRDRHSANGGAATAMEEALTAGIPVVLFPEGTSSDGTSVLPFHSGFFEPAMRANSVVTAAAIDYTGGTAAESAIAYYGDDIFAPHLFRTLGERHLEARVVFSSESKRYAGRKEAARATQADVCLLRNVVAEQRTVARQSPALVRLTHAG
jgi:lyso-ornithine lipid O-acyltransferase